MRHTLRPIAAIVLMSAGIGSGCAEEGAGGPRAGDTQHYTNIDGAFLSGQGFASGPQTYALHQGAEETGEARIRGAKSELPENGAHFSRAEYLFMTGAGFNSGPEGYPFSW